MVIEIAKIQMSAIEARDLTKVYRTYRKESDCAGRSGTGAAALRRDRAADAVSFQSKKVNFVGFSAEWRRKRQC